MAERRDDFSGTVKMALAGRVGWKCSFPNCPATTAGPAQESPDKWIRNGIAAHITAAAPGGPRYDANLTPEQRSDISNGIWMCPTHGSLIDKEKTAYKADEIRAWKIAAESRATRELELSHSNGHPNTASRYSSKDTATLEKYSEVMSYTTIELIRNEQFGSFVRDSVTNPLYEIMGMHENPRFKFQDVNLEKLRQLLYSQVIDFFRHFGQQSAGGRGGYEFVDMGQLTRADPSSRGYWENYVSETQKLAEKLCATAMQLLVIKENN
jgi:hypothetical protein